jgi:hypothetical protein
MSRTVVIVGRNIERQREQIKYKSTIVVPAKAGTQSNPAGAVVVWMPAYAGMTDGKMAMVGKLFVASAGEHGMVEVLERQDGR